MGEGKNVILILDRDTCDACGACEQEYPGIMELMRDNRREFPDRDVTAVFRAMRACKKMALMPEETFW